MYDVYAEKEAKLKRCDPDHISFFGLTDHIFEEPPKTNKHQFNPEPLHRIFTLMRKMEAKAFITERLENSTELEDEQKMAENRTGKHVELEAKRLTFFCKFPKGGKWRDETELPEDSILGYIVLLVLIINAEHRISYILEAALRPPSVVLSPSITDSPEGDIVVFPITNSYVHNMRNFKTHIGTREASRFFSFQGSFFAQQNDLTHVCAHAALRTAINSSPHFGKRKLTNKQINDILGLDFSDPKKSVGHFDGDEDGTKRGLTKDEIKRVAKSLNTTVFDGDFTKNSKIEYDEYIYPVLESGYPVILAVEGWDVRRAQPVCHAVAVLGHTLNTDRWNPQANVGYGNFPLTDYIPVTSWCDHYIVSDDNYGIYTTLPSDRIRNFIVPNKNPSLHATVAISILPESINIEGYAAEKISMGFARRLINNLPDSTTFWLERLKRNIDGSLIGRTILYTGSDYRDYLKNLAEEHSHTLNTECTKRLKRLTKFVWVTEISIPNIYEGNKHKLGDVVIRANSPEKEYMESKGIIMTWLPGIICFGQGDLFEPWFVEEHVPFIRRKELPPLEW